ncbi:Uncharacterized membrane protein YccC [Granulicella rosea]|uniref:Uncharacterized membrane protein YccC n=1 Tax=Granulicella rosea TaxID=474952 RepID=A0A239L4J8_9BACT|nr:FUSC family protein [Granulicella rosea]SNT25527.1 Uncharacterized membrane protein YccC [Granulicella rosea]
MTWLARLERFSRTLHWRRGVRAGLAVGSAMITCRMLGQPMGWAALGGFEAVLVDNGGPYRTRLVTMLTVLAGGALGVFVGAAAPGWGSGAALAATMLLTAAFCFAVTFARVVAQPIASTSVVILVIYFAGLGSEDHSLHGASLAAGMLCAGGLWAAALSLVLWPVDPFRPARLGVAGCYLALSEETARLGWGPGERVDRRPPHVWHRELRVKLEAARAALAATPARAPARTVTARSLSVLLETADMLFARTLRLAEMIDVTPAGELRESLAEVTAWLAGAERVIAEQLEQRPMDGGASFAPHGSHRWQHVERRLGMLAADEAISPHRDIERSPMSPVPHTLRDHLEQEERQAAQEIEIGFEATHALWTGMDSSRLRGARHGTPEFPEADAGTDSDAEPDSNAWLDALRSDFTLDSVMMRHAIRMAVVGAADVALMRIVHVSHGFWLAMTSIIVLQPYGSATLRRSAQRVGGTIAGGVLAAVLAVGIRSPVGMMLTIALFATLTLATYAVDYGLYSFFLTPTFVLMSLPHPRDWAYAGVRMGTTVLGAATAIIAMRLIWPEKPGIELGRKLARCAAADAAYLRVILIFWTLPDRRRAERNVLAPARRACGLASNDAEEAVDRMMQEPGFGALGLAAEDVEKEQALTFTTYTRRLTQTVTTLAATGRATTSSIDRIEGLACRLERLSARLAAGSCAAHELWPPETGRIALVSVAEEQMQRMERQLAVLERTAELLGDGLKAAP